MSDHLYFCSLLFWEEVIFFSNNFFIYFWKCKFDLECSKFFDLTGFFYDVCRICLLRLLVLRRILNLVRICGGFHSGFLLEFKDKRKEFICCFEGFISFLLSNYYSLLTKSLYWKKYILFSNWSTIYVDLLCNLQIYV